jgi:hypothetical protein
MRQWWCPPSTRPTRWVGSSVCYFTETTVRSIPVALPRHLFLKPSKLVFAPPPSCCVLRREATHTKYIVFGLIGPVRSTELEVSELTIILLMRLIINLIKIISLPCTPILIFRGMGYLMKPHYGSRASQWKCRLQKHENITKLICILRTIRLAEWRIYHIVIYSWHKIMQIWPIMWFLQISHAATYE